MNETLSPQKKAWITRRENQKKDLYYKNVDGHAKEAFRNKKVDLYINSNITNGNFGFLPSVTCKDIMLIQTRFPNSCYNFLGCEFDEETFRQINHMLDSKSVPSFALYNLDVLNLIKTSSEDEYAHFDIDLCQTFSKYKHYIEEALKRKIVQKDGIISFTFSCRDKNIKEVARETLGEEEFNKISEKINKSGVLKGGYTLPTINKWIKEICGNDFEIAVAPFTYLDTCNMVAGSVRRIK